MDGKSVRQMEWEMVPVTTHCPNPFMSSPHMRFFPLIVSVFRKKKRQGHSKEWSTGLTPNSFYSSKYGPI